MKSSYAKRSGLIASAVALGLVLAACGSSSSSPTTTAGTTGSTSGSSGHGNGAPIKIALIASLTGADAAQNGDSAIGFTARVDAQNALGGVNGHKIDPIIIDDQTSPTQVVTAVQQAISDGVTGIVSNTPLMFEAAKYAQQAGIPVTGGAFDGSEWGTQPNTNMFPSDTENTNPESPWSTSYGDFFKKYGGTVVGTYGYGISPSSTHATYASAKSSLAAGLKVGVMDVSVQFGSESFGTEALAAKSANVNAFTSQMDVNSNIALLSAMKQDGLTPKVTTFATGYQDSLPGSNVWSTVQGVYFGASIRPWNIPLNAGTTAEKAALTKYGKFTSSMFPDLGQNESYLGADLMILGLSKAGANPTPASVITALRNTTDYNANGLLPVTLNYKINFGYNTHVGCEWYEKAETKTFVAVSATPTCTTYIPGSTSLTPPKI
jgi:branched-chain amino acid transport system substrate-binding protein